MLDRSQRAGRHTEYTAEEKRGDQRQQKQDGHRLADQFRPDKTQAEVGGGADGADAAAAKKTEVQQPDHAQRGEPAFGMVPHRKHARNGQQNGQHNDVGDFPVERLEKEFLRNVVLFKFGQLLRWRSLAVLRILGEQCQRREQEQKGDLKNHC